tara:strand:+ start:8285 stop:9256 length:972 start_codon:yes stop_codon:yes gene_type:complete
MWEHPQIRRLLQIGNEVFPNPTPSPSSGNPLFRSLETSETKTLAEWESGYVVRANNNNTFSALPKNGYGLTLTLMPVQSMGAETFRQEADPTPSSYDWFDVNAPVTAFGYTPPADKKRKVTLTLPLDFAEYIVSTDGVTYPHNGMGSVTIVLNSKTGDTLRIGGVSSASIADPDMDDYSSINLPDLSFTTSGVNYALDTNRWGREHKMVRGAYAKGFGYNIPPNTVKSLPEGKKAYGGASIYEELSTVDMVWGREVGVEADDKPECSEGYTYNETTQQCELDDTNGNGNGNGNGDETEGMDADTLMKYGLYGLLAVAAISLLK